MKNSIMNPNIRLDLGGYYWIDPLTNCYRDNPNHKFKPPRKEAVRRAKDWITAFGRPSKSQEFSYSLKHLCEEWGTGHMGNGEFIQAALDMGYPVHPDRPNAYIEIDITRWWVYDARQKLAKPTYQDMDTLRDIVGSSRCLKHPIPLKDVNLKAFAKRHPNWHPDMQYVMPWEYNKYPVIPTHGDILWVLETYYPNAVRWRGTGYDLSPYVYTRGIEETFNTIEHVPFRPCKARKAEDEILVIEPLGCPLHPRLAHRR